MIKLEQLSHPLFPIFTIPLWWEYSKSFENFIKYILLLTIVTLLSYRTQYILWGFQQSLSRCRINTNPVFHESGIVTENIHSRVALLILIPFSNVESNLDGCTRSMLLLFKYRNNSLGWMWWNMPVLSANQKVEVGRSQSEGDLGKSVKNYFKTS